MGVTVTAPNNGSDYVEFKNQAGASLAKVGGYDDGSSNGHIEIYTTASGTPTERVRIDNAGNVGIGTSSPSCKTDVAGTIRSTGSGVSASGVGVEVDYGAIAANTGRIFAFDRSTSTRKDMAIDGANTLFYTGGSERMRIDSSGNLLVRTTSAINSYTAVQVVGTGGTNDSFAVKNTNTSSLAAFSCWNSSGNYVGGITFNNTTTSFPTSSDYRLKENIRPMTNALSVVSQLNPVTYTWKADGSDGQGFIAHELQAVVPDCVTGEKDAVDAEGNPVYQGIDTSFLVATLTKAIQELKAELDDAKTRIATLEAK